MSSRRRTCLYSSNSRGNKKWQWSVTRDNQSCNPPDNPSTNPLSYPLTQEDVTNIVQSPPHPPPILEYLRSLAGFQLLYHFQAGILCCLVTRTGSWYACFWLVSHKDLELAKITELLLVNQPSRIYLEWYPTQRWWTSIYKQKLTWEEWLALCHWIPPQQPTSVSLKSSRKAINLTYGN